MGSQTPFTDSCLAIAEQYPSVTRTWALLSQRVHGALLLLVHCEGSSRGQSSPSAGGHRLLVLRMTRSSEVVESRAKYESHYIKLFFRQEIAALFCVLIGVVGGSADPCLS